MQNLTASLRYHAARRPDATALVYGQQRVTYREMLERAVDLAGWLDEAGVTVGTVVALVMKNSPAFLDLAYAVSHLGAVLLPMNYRLSAEEIAYIAADSGAELLFVDEELVPLAEATGLRRIVVSPAMQADMRALRDAAASPRERVVSARRQGEDLFRLMYTSGTTDRPKGVTHSYANLFWKCLDQTIDLAITRDDCLCIVGPLYHVGAFDLPGLTVLQMGGTVTLLREFNPETVLATIERDQVTGIWMAPVMINRVLDKARRGGWDLTSLRWCIAGGDRTLEARIREFSRTFPNARFIDSYGLTETCSGDTTMEPGMEIAKIGSVGRPLAHVEIEIRDDAGAAQPSGVAGEICIRGDKVTKGYWNDPERTAAAFWPGGWFRSGDIGYLDADGFLYVVDRRKDLIISGGENISPSEVERVVRQLPQIDDVAVVARRDPEWGERPVAFIVMQPGSVLDLASLAEHCRRHLAGFKIPREMHVVEQLPRNPSGKVLRRDLRNRLDAGDVPTRPHSGS